MILLLNSSARLLLLAPLHSLQLVCPTARAPLFRFSLLISKSKSQLSALVLGIAAAIWRILFG